MKKKILEKDIQKLILEWLRWNKVFCWKMNNSAVYIKSKDRYMKSPLRGVSDILGILPNSGGQFLAIEIKREGNKPSPEQKDFIEKIKENNGVAFVAYSLEDVVKVLQSYLDGG